MPLTSIIPTIMGYALLALHETPDQPANGLTRHESASIYLYTMDWNDPEESLNTKLNRTLSRADRDELRPWFQYLKLLLTALVKLPPVHSCRLWCAVPKNMTVNLSRGTPLIWWEFVSTTASLTILQNNLRLEQPGERTWLAIESINGRNVQAHSYHHDAKEVLLLPGTSLEVESLSHPTPDLYIIHLKQVKPSSELLEPPFPGQLSDRRDFPFRSAFVLLGASLYPTFSWPKRFWFILKAHLTSIFLLLILCTIGTAAGFLAVVRFQNRTEDSSDEHRVINWNGGDWAVCCDFLGNDFFRTTALPALCAEICKKLPQCTHYVWSFGIGGTCQLKQGTISKLDAIFDPNPTKICGVVSRRNRTRIRSSVFISLR